MNRVFANLLYVPEHESINPHTGERKKIKAHWEGRAKYKCRKKTEEIVVIKSTKFEVMEIIEKVVRAENPKIEIQERELW